MERNRFEHLHIPGVVGVDTRSDVETIPFDKGNYTLLVREIQPGKWDYGYKTLVGNCTEKMPGEGSGWFRTKKDATLYGLEALRHNASPDVKAEIEATIYGMMQHTLDLL